MSNFVTVEKFAEISGYSVRAIRAKILAGTWLEGKVYKRSPDNRILIDQIGYDTWVTSSAPPKAYRYRSKLVG